MVEANTSAREYPRPYCVETRECGITEQQGHGEHEERDLAGARNHTIINLHHVERAGQIQQVNGQAEHCSRGEIALAGLQQLPEFVGGLTRNNHFSYLAEKPLPLCRL